MLFAWLAWRPSSRAQAVELAAGHSGQAQRGLLRHHTAKQTARGLGLIAETYAVSRDAGLLQALTTTDRLSDLLPVLHHHAVSAVSGRGSILFQFSRTRRRPSGDLGVRHRPSAARSVAGPLTCRIRCCTMASRCSCPISAGSFAASASIWIPLRRCSFRVADIDDSLGILIVGSTSAPSLEQLREVGVGRTCVRDRARAHARRRANRTCSSSCEICCRIFHGPSRRRRCRAGLEALCAGANRLFGADRTRSGFTIGARAWSCLSASSDVVYLARERRIPASPMRWRRPRSASKRDRAEIAIERRPTGMVTVPLRGQRRALGTLIMDEVRLDRDREIDAAGSRRRAGPTSVGRHRERPAARRRAPIAARAGEYVQLARRSGGRHPIRTAGSVYANRAFLERMRQARRMI